MFVVLFEDDIELEAAREFCISNFVRHRRIDRDNFCVDISNQNHEIIIECSPPPRRQCNVTVI